MGSIYDRPTITGLQYPKMKSVRAGVHLKELEAEVRHFLEADPYLVTRKDNVKKHWHIISVEIKPCRDMIPLLMGEFAYSLRSALDQLAWQLALTVAGRPNSHTSFPIRGAVPPKGFGDTARDIPPKAFSIIEPLQPYHRGSAFKNHPLWILNELCITDKHATPAVNSSAGSFRINGAPILARRERDYSTELTVSSSDKFKAQFDPDPPEIIFGKPADSAGPWFEVRIGALRAIYDFVRNDVVPRFYGFFP